jgi:hypothetical protein
VSIFNCLVIINLGAISYSIKELTVYGRTVASCETPKGLTVNMIDTASAVIRWYPENKATAYTLTLQEQTLEIRQMLSILFTKISVVMVMLKPR